MTRQSRVASSRWRNHFAAREISAALAGPTPVAPDRSNIHSQAGVIAARIERMPFASWYIRLLTITGSAHLFDAFDAIVLSVVLPVLIATWKITPAQAGLLISAGFLGQLLGAFTFGSLADRFGRIPALRWSLGLMALFSVGCSFAPSYAVMLGLRALQGLGLGGEVPVAATLVNECTPGRFRGRMVCSLQCMFAIGVMATAMIATWVVPSFGWRAMFLIGALPIIPVFALSLLPESPRWLAMRGKSDKAEASMRRIEQAVSRSLGRPLPEPMVIAGPVAQRASFSALFSRQYLARTLTVWLMMFCTATAGYGMLQWLPTLYRTVYHLPLVDAYRLSTLAGAAGLIGLLIGVSMIDAAGRRLTFMLAFFGCALPLIALGLVAKPSITLVVSLATLGYLCISMVLGGVWVYTTEIYPTRMRVLGAGTGSAWMRIAAIVSPSIVGGLLSRGLPGLVFSFFGVAALVGGVTVAMFALETRNKPLEELSQ